MTAADVAYRGIHQMLASGELLPGQRLSQSRLARQLQCSPMPVVEAMRRLESEGLLDKQARKQARVRKLSREDLDGLYLLREAIETVIARLAAERINSEESQTLQELARTYERAWEAQDQEAEADVAIHRHIAECARCPLLQGELERFRLIELSAVCTNIETTQGVVKPKATSPDAPHRIGIALRKHQDDGVHTYRIAALGTSPKGTLLCVYDMRRRTGRGDRRSL